MRPRVKISKISCDSNELNCHTYIRAYIRNCAWLTVVDAFIIEFAFCFFPQSGWSISVHIVIGPDVGISYLTEKASTVRIV